MGEHVGSSANGSGLPSSGSTPGARTPRAPWPGRTLLVVALAVLVLAGGVLVRGRAAGGLSPSVLLGRVALPADARVTATGVPVPTTAEPCPARGRPASGGVRWCPPAGVSADTLDRWYARALPRGHDAGALRWCVGQVLENGTHRALWSSGRSLVGYDLPEPGHARRAVVDVLRLPDHRCPAAARASRQVGA